MSTYRVEKDGSLTFPNRGRPPAAVEGYAIDPRDPFRQTPIWPVCALRHTQIIALKCGSKKEMITCLAGKEAGYEQCKQCAESGDQARLLVELGVE